MRYTVLLDSFLNILYLLGKDEKSKALDFTAVSTHTRAILTESKYI